MRKSEDQTHKTMEGKPKIPYYLSSRSKTKGVCPRCDKKSLVLYINGHTGFTVGAGAGYCTRCGYHRTPEGELPSHPLFSGLEYIKR
ncbi:hypothetical protein [Spirosoma flavus]